ncbi:MAG: hypothetical protein AAF849_25210 [Bacteroidota bacterium]
MQIIKQQKRLVLPQKVALIGNFETFNFSIPQTHFIDFFQARKIETSFAKGYEEEDDIDESLLNEAQRKAQAADVAFVLLYAPEGANKIPITQHQLIRSVSLVQSNLLALVYARAEIKTAWKKYTYSSLQIDEEIEITEIMEEIFTL